MTREQASKWIKEIEAFADGGEILWYHSKHKEWYIHTEPTWSMDILYVINDKHVEARKAFALGEHIEIRGFNTWELCCNPTWMDTCEYRPEPTWKPKAGEMIEVRTSTNGDWQQREFICMTKDGKRFACHYLQGTEVRTWTEARELQC